MPAMASRSDDMPPADDAADTLFHPAVAGWLHERFGKPTEVQARAIAAFRR
jgi:Lhr-like helicase